MVPDGATRRGPSHPVSHHMPSKAADDGALQTASGLGLAHAEHGCKSKGGRDSDEAHGSAPRDQEGMKRGPAAPRSTANVALPVGSESQGATSRRALPCDEHRLARQPPGWSPQPRIASPERRQARTHDHRPEHEQPAARAVERRLLNGSPRSDSGEHHARAEADQAQMITDGASVSTMDR